MFLETQLGKASKQARSSSSQLSLAVYTHLLDEKLSVGAQKLPELPRCLQLQLRQVFFGLSVAETAAVEGPGFEASF